MKAEAGFLLPDDAVVLEKYNEETEKTEHVLIRIKDNWYYAS